MRAWIRWRGWLLPGLALLAFTLPKLGQGDFRTDTGWYSAIAVQSVRTGELWTLYADPGQTYFNKPPLAFWIHGLALDWFGVSLELARLPTILAALCVVLATVGLVRTLSGPRVALISGMALATTYEFFRRTREISLDMWQALWLVLALWLAAVAVRRGRWWCLASCGVPIGLALMTKPLVGLVALPIIGAWIVWIGEWRRLGWFVLGALIAVAIAAPWHVSMWQTHGDEFLRQYFGAEIAGRVEHKLAASDAPPWWWYGKLIGRSYWPWLVFVALGVAAMLRGRGLSRIPAGPRLATLWVVVWLVVLTVFPDKRARYALVLWPSLAWLAGLWLANRPWPILRGGRWTWEVLTALIVAGGVALSLAPVRVQRPPNPQWDELFEWMRENDVDEGELWQGGFTGIRGCRVYLEFGWWPVPTRNRWGEPVSAPPVETLLVYHADDQVAPGSNERVLFESDKLRVTRLIEGAWAPVFTDKPEGDEW